MEFLKIYLTTCGMLSQLLVLYSIYTIFKDIILAISIVNWEYKAAKIQYPTCNINKLKFKFYSFWEHVFNIPEKITWADGFWYGFNNYHVPTEPCKLDKMINEEIKKDKTKK